MDLLPNEAKMFEVAPAVGSPHSGDDEAINDRYTSGEVRIVTEQARYPLTAIPGMVNSNDYELNPEFQRRHRWNDVRKSRLIESFIMNVPIPPIFLYEARYSFYEVMDGLQRLSAIRDFYADEFALDGLQEWSELNGKRYSQLPAEVRKGVDRRYLSSIILLHETAKSEEEAQRLKQLVFERINSGGERLTPQESRNAIFPGPMNSLCIELSRDENLRTLWHIPEADGETEEDFGRPEIEHQLGKSLFKTMGDVELVLRFFAYRQQLKSQERLTLRDYLDTYLRRGNALPKSELQDLSQIFKSATEIVLMVFGEYALYMYKEYKGKWRYTGRPTLTVYDPLMWAVSANIDKSAELAKRSQSARDLLKEMYKQHPQSFSGRTAERPDIENRNKLFLDLIEKILQSPPDPEGVVSSIPETDTEALEIGDAGTEGSQYPAGWASS
ncbi:DUF262 domain-containing protein [Micromonospora sp. H61]|uniref:DUF262 domain-containing protein n=1 Tax=Micromonospora sp. H61 TaxID=2824888 RepID=UPI001B3935AA|nr:DUF262 domain-containing protein [Micromonospora sp. H61]MBQ0988803.1 DUF262 domain-containing protein [Micromonospora sp. H61]